MVALPAGIFIMGSPPDEVNRFDREGPQREVAIGYQVAIGKYEVTFDDWDACVADGGCKVLLDDAGWGRGRLPLTNVSWDDAQQYVSWLSARTAKTYRLPSEAEWEYAARAGTHTPFSFGETLSTVQANYNGTYAYGSGQPGENRQRTTPVDAFPANSFGLHDMHGNVREWVQDCWNESYAGAPIDGSAWLSGDCSYHAYRGGSWNNHPGALRSANRYRNTPDYRFNYLGFRVVRTL